MGGFNGDVGKRIEGYEGEHGRNGIGDRNEEGLRWTLYWWEREIEST